MLGTSQTILAKRMHDDQDRLVYPSFNGKVIPNDDRILIAIPVLVYEMDVKELIDTNNIFISTVTQLARIKQKDITDNGQLYDYISQKTGLSRVLVKSILKENELNQDIETKEENKSPQHSIKYIVYNPITNTFFPNTISSESYDKYTKASRVFPNDIEISFRLQEAQGWQNALILHSDKYDEDRTLRNPTMLIDKTPGLRQRLFTPTIGNSDVYYTGQCFTAWALCYCYLTEYDLTSLHLSNPVGHGDIDTMFPGLLEMMKKHSNANEELINQINFLESSRKDRLDAAGNWDQQLAEQEKEVRAKYPKLSENATMLNRVTELEQALHGTDSDKVMIAFHEFLEDILLYSCQHNVPTGSDWHEYDKRCQTIDKNGDKTDLLVGFAEEAGFISNDADREIAQKCFTFKLSKKEKNIVAKKQVYSDYETDTSIVGVSFNNDGPNAENRQVIIQDLIAKGLLAKSSELKLELDPTNKFDSNAIKVIASDGRQIGNLPKALAEIVASRVRNGEHYHAIVTAIKGGDGFRYGVDIHIKGYSPRSSESNIPSQMYSKGFIQKNQLLKLLRGNDVYASGNLPERLAANIIQSVVNPNHPLRVLASSCPNLVSIVYYSMSFRNKTKHENEIEKSFEAFVSRDVIERTMDAMISSILHIEKLTGDKLEAERNARISHQKAQIEAAAMMNSYPMLQQFRNGKPLSSVCTKFTCRDSQYFSVCSNLVDKLLIELLSEATELSQRQHIAMDFFTGDRYEDAAKMVKIFAEIGCEYDSDDYPTTQKIKASWNSDMLTLKNKLFLCFATLYKYNRPYLDSIVQYAPELPYLTDLICVNRIHSNNTDFNDSEDGYRGFHSKLLNCCENLYKLIIDV